jgi:hypothetical protein
MALITSGTVGTLKSITLENRILEAFVTCEYQQAEKTANNVTINTNINTLTANINFSLPVSITTNPSGNVEFVANDYLGFTDFDPGENGTFTGTTLEQQILEMLVLAKEWEKDPLRNPNGTQAINATYNLSNNILSGTASLSIAVQTLGTGGTQIVANEYLIDIAEV